MRVREKTKEQLIKELSGLRRRNAYIEKRAAALEKLEETVSRGKREWEEIFDALNDAITIHDADFTIIRANKAAERMLGLPLKKILGRKCHELYHGTLGPPRSCATCQSLRTGALTTTESYEPHLKDFLEIKAFPLFDKNSRISRFVHVVRDITRRKKMEERLLTLSLTDELTGLYNRRGFFNLADKQVKLAKRLKKRIMLLTADLDNLKEINDRYGHHKGDETLIQIADILKETFRGSDIVARVGGDEFAVLQIGYTDAPLEALSVRLQRNIAEHNARHRNPFDLSLSVGIACLNPASSCSVDRLLAKADQLMYKEKRLKRESARRPGRNDG